jgi:hypothetical protein
MEKDISGVAEHASSLVRWKQPVPAALLGACSGRRPAGMFSCCETKPAHSGGVSEEIKKIVSS